METYTSTSYCGTQIIADACDLDRGSVRYWCRTGTLKAKQLDGNWRIYHDDLLRHFATHPKHNELLRRATPRSMNGARMRRYILNQIEREEFRYEAS